MASKFVVYQKCAQCGGTGQQPTGHVSGGIGPTIPCTWPNCTDPSLGEIGEYPIGHIYIDLEEISAKLDVVDAKVQMLIDAPGPP